MYEVLEFKATLENVDYQKLSADQALFRETRRAVAVELAAKAGVRSEDVTVRLLPGSLRIEAEIRVSEAAALTPAAGRAALERRSAGYELLAALATQPRSRPAAAGWAQSLAKRAQAGSALRCRLAADSMVTKNNYIVEKIRV